MIPLLIITVLLLFAAFALFSLRILFLKDGTFRGTCAGNSPYLNKEGVVCGVCGKVPSEGCAQEDDEKLISKNPA